MMQHILRGEMPRLRITIDTDPRPWAYGFELRLEIWIDLFWVHYEDIFGVSPAPWHPKSKSEFPF